MGGIKNLDELIKSMKPELNRGKFVFCTILKDKLDMLKVKPMMLFEEKEGITIIIKKEDADNNKLNYENIWAMITLNVHSDLSAIGFLARITNKLAENGISVNAVSAFYHDHLFVPFDKAEMAIKLLNSLSK